MVGEGDRTGQPRGVITSYSIHYTKLYEGGLAHIPGQELTVLVMATAGRIGGQSVQMRETPSRREVKATSLPSGEAAGSLSDPE